MNPSFYNQFNQFIVLGSNFTKADARIRSRFGMTKSRTDSIYAFATQLGLKDFLVLSTCNRTEFYAFAPYPIVKKLIVEALNVNDQELDSYFYAYTDIDAVRHFSNVVGGLDSQIIGEYEIVGQVKKAITHARESGLVGTLLDRIANFAFQASKKIKTKTRLSNGKYSVSYAAAELIVSHQNGNPFKNILVVGTGETGHAMARNLTEYLPQCKLSLTNRTYSHAEALALEIDANIIPFSQFTEQLGAFDAVITTAEAENYLIHVNDIPVGKSGLYLDLSVPQVVDPEIKNLAGITHYSVDEISAFHNELLKQRHAEIPKAEGIIEDYVQKLMEWQSVFRYTGILVDYKKKMGRIIHNGGNPKAKIEKSFSGLIQQIKSDGYHGCSVIQTVNELMAHEK